MSDIFVNKNYLGSKVILCRINIFSVCGRNSIVARPRDRFGLCLRTKDVDKYRWSRVGRFPTPIIKRPFFPGCSSTYQPLFLSRNIPQASVKRCRIFTSVPTARIIQDYIYPASLCPL